MLSDNNSKEAIKSRMLRYALNYWSLKNVEDLDPVVKLIMEALSLELYNLGNEVQDAQVRILEKIAGLLAPDFLTAPNPAHAILHATPLEPTESLANTASFLTPSRAVPGQNGPAGKSPEIFFTPVDAVRLFDIQMACFVAGAHLFTYDASSTRLHAAAKSREKISENNILWLGLRINTGIENVEGLFFYFDWKNLEPGSAQRTYQLLPLTKWFIGDTELGTSSGLPYAEDPKQTDPYQAVFLEYDTLHLIEKDIKQFYNSKYISITNQGNVDLKAAKCLYPPAFKDIFTDKHLQTLKEPLLWIKVVFPTTLHPHFNNELHVHPNAFPVMNRKLKDWKYRLKGGSHIIPLPMEPFDQFLFMKSLSDDTREYKQVPYQKKEDEETGTFTLRKGGVSRFDERNARELIGYLLEMLRSESAAFAAYGYDFIATTLKEMNQKISLMEQKTKGHMKENEVMNYVIVKPFEGKDMMYAEYWTTLAEAANNLRAGTQLQQGKGVKLRQGSIALLTPTIGGKNRLRPDERLSALRYGIMTRNRIITKEDIRSFCFYELGDRVRKVSVERGFEISGNEKEAFKRTINVVLTPFETESLDSKEWQVLCDLLALKLQSRSGMSSDYRVTLQKQ